MPLYGHELNESIDPYQAGLSFACSLKDRQFIGSDALAKKSIDQGLLKRVGIVLTGRRAAREGSELRDQDNRVVGAVTSGSFSPTLDKPIAMAYVPSEVSQPGTVLDVDIRGTRVSATVTVLPFYKRP
jgi:aminomethyltransferase